MLAVCPGSLALERALHTELAAYRIGKHEDFWPSDEVWAVVRRIRRARIAA